MQDHIVDTAPHGSVSRPFHARFAPFRDAEDEKRADVLRREGTALKEEGEGLLAEAAALAPAPLPGPPARRIYTVPVHKVAGLSIDAIHSMLDRAAHAGVLRAFLRSDAPTAEECARHWVDALVALGFPRHATWLGHPGNVKGPIKDALAEGFGARAQMFGGLTDDFAARIVLTADLLWTRQRASALAEALDAATCSRGSAS